MDVVLRKVGRGKTAAGRLLAGGGPSAKAARGGARGGTQGSVAGTLLRPPAAGFSLIVTFPDGKHEYITTPVRRLFRILGTNTVYVQTANSTYRLEFLPYADVVAKARSR